MKIDKSRVTFVWRRGGNWIVFLILWIISAAIIGAIESSREEHKLTEEAKMTMESRKMAAELAEMREYLENSEGQEHLDRLIQLVSRDQFPRIWALGEHDFDGHIDIVRLKLEMMQKEFRKVRAELEKDDRQGKEIVSELISIMSDNKTAHMLDQVQTARINNAKNESSVWDDPDWEFGDSLHYVSSVFTTIGYGARTPLTIGGKMMTVLMVISLLPFFLHCLCTSATNINNLIDRLLGLSEHYDDLDELTAEKRNDNQRLRREVMWKGSLVLLAVLLVHMFLSSIYHVITTGWNYGDIIYFEFVNYSTIGFGDLVPEDELTVAGAIFKNLLVKIPAAMLLLTVFLRLLPVIS